MERGYSTIAMHGYEGSFWSRDAAYETQGFERFMDKDGFRVKGTETAWGLNDEDFFSQAVDYLKKQEKPFYGFLVSLSNHTPFELPQDLCSLDLKTEHVGTMFGNYLQSVHYADEALGVLIRELKKAKLYDDTVIAIYGDHFGLSVSDEENVKYMSEFLGRDYKFSDAANVPLVIHIPGVEKVLAAELPKTVSVAGGQTDFLPTMAYLMDFEKLDTLYMGQNLLAKDAVGYVIQYRYAQPGSFLTDTYCYNASSDGLFANGKAYVVKNGERLKLTEDMRALYIRALGLTQKVQEILDTDALRPLYYADGQPDRVETVLVELSKSVVKPTVTVEPSAPVDPVDDLVVTGPAIDVPEAEEPTVGEPDEVENDGGNVPTAVI